MSTQLTLDLRISLSLHLTNFYHYQHLMIMLSLRSLTFTVKNVFAAKLSLTNPRFRSCRGYRSRASRGRYFEASDRGGWSAWSGWSRLPGKFVAQSRGTSIRSTRNWSTKCVRTIRRRRDIRSKWPTAARPRSSPWIGRRTPGSWIMIIFYKIWVNQCLVFDLFSSFSQ